MKIPWSDLYGSPVEAAVEGLYIIVQPNLEVVYDMEKENKKLLEAKRKEITKIEEAKKKEAERSEVKIADPGFVEKLTTQIIKNVQIKISDIHIRYEDSVSNPGNPFAVGVTLSHLTVVSTNAEWVPSITKEASTKIFKVIKIVSR